MTTTVETSASGVPLMRCVVPLTRDPQSHCLRDTHTICMECERQLCDRHAFPSAEAIRPLCPDCAPLREKLRHLDFLPEMVRFAGFSEPAIAGILLAVGVLIGVIGCETVEMFL
jgi:hypothetical protein